MRNVFLFGLLIWLLAFAYQKWVLEPDVSIEATHMVQDVPELSVVARNSAESPKVLAGAVNESKSPVIAESVAVAYRCLRIGPFPREVDAEEVRAVLQSREATVRQTTEESQVWVGYWVQSAGQGSPAAANQVKADLAIGGLKDAYVLAEDTNYRISLGIFRLKSSANVIVRKAQNLGVDTRVIERYQPGTNFWLLVRIPESQPLQRSELPGVSGQILRMEKLSCETAGV